MKQYDFTLKFNIQGTNADHEQLVERLGAAGCDDALVGIGQAGRIALHFTREASSADEALFSALADVKRAIPEARLVEASPDFVGLTDVAEVMGFTRQNMRKLVVTHGAAFPEPVHEGTPTVWHLAQVLLWFREKGSYQVEEGLIEVAQTAMQLNIAKEMGNLKKSTVQRKVRELLA